MNNPSDLPPQAFCARLNGVKNTLFPFLVVEAGENSRKIPVFTIRNPGHTVLISNWMASGCVGVIENGLMGAVKAVSCDPAAEELSGREFWQIKKGRSLLDKVPALVPPDAHERIVDYDRLHPDFARLRDPQVRRRFFDRLPFHTILPVAENARINRSVFVTTPDEARQKSTDPDQWTSLPTVCLFYPGGDPSWDKVTAHISRITPEVLIGVTSLNDHTTQPPYDLGELIEYVNTRKQVDFRFVIQDPLSRSARIRSSHTQVRLPARDEPPEVRVVRKGSVGLDLLRQHLDGYPVREINGAKTASHGHPAEVRRQGLDARVRDYLRRAAVFGDQSAV